MPGRSTTCTATPTPLVAAKEMSAYGWVTVDPADVRKAMLTKILDLDNPKTIEYREFFWGGIAPPPGGDCTGTRCAAQPASNRPAPQHLRLPLCRDEGQILDFFRQSQGFFPQLQFQGKIIILILAFIKPIRWVIFIQPRYASGLFSMGGTIIAIYCFTVLLYHWNRFIIKIIPYRMH